MRAQVFGLFSQFCIFASFSDIGRFEISVCPEIDTRYFVFLSYVNVSEPVVQPVSDIVSDSKTACMFYKGTLRSGQVFESDGSVVVLGDVNPGGKVVAKGSVIVLGSLKGNIFAGVDGNENAFVVALEMSPMQIKIGEIIARSSDTGTKITKGRNKTKVIEPKIAYVYDQNIYIEDLEQNALDDICLD